MVLQNTKGFGPVVAAVGGNFFVTILKFIAAFASGSSSMLSEAVHSLADTINQVLLLIGLQRSTKKADDEFGYGYGRERFFWALISACGVFFVGAGVTAYHGVTAIMSPHQIEFSLIVFVVLFAAFIIEFYTFWVAASALRKDFPTATWSERISEADPSTLAVFLEDLVAVVGIFVASVSITLTYLTHNAIWDAMGSLIIAFLLATVAITLIIKNRSYLLGRAVPENVREGVIELLNTEPSIEKVIDFKSSAVAFGMYRIKCEVEFNGSALLAETHQMENLTSEFEDIQSDFEAFKRFCVDFADRIPRLIGRKIDEIESRIKKQYPSIRHIDIEVN